MAAKDRPDDHDLLVALRHPLEVLQFPPDKGDPRWQGADGRLFLVRSCV